MVVFMRGAKSIRSLQQGYTVIEVTIIIIVVAILAAIMVDSAVGYQIRARDSERASDVDVITRSLERYYRTQAVAVGGSYPASNNSGKVSRSRAKGNTASRVAWPAAR